MFPRGLIIAISVGVIAGPIFGILFFEVGIEEQLVFVEGDSFSIVTEKTNFKIGEDVLIKIVNSGTTNLIFSDLSHGLEIRQLDGILVFKPSSGQMITSLEPQQEFEFIWNQKKNDGKQVLEGIYKITSNAITKNENNLVKSITINILK